jgi:S-disulfanyl-L-cysteine oxidoreductase SoxD
MRRALAFAALATLVPLVAAVAPPTAGSRMGVYSAKQAEQGAQIYADSCAMCHGARLEGTVEVPGLTGKFVANWGGRPLGELYDYLGRAMPQSAPGSLPPQDNAKLIALLLKANGAPSSAKVLPADNAALHRITFDPARVGL